MADAAPACTFRKLVDTLDERYAPIQFESALADEAIQDGNLTRYARRILAAGILEVMPEGWEPDDDFRRAEAFARWSSSIALLAPSHSLDEIYDRLEQGEPPRGWLPSGPDDDRIVAAFGDATFELKR